MSISTIHFSCFLTNTTTSVLYSIYIYTTIINECTDTTYMEHRYFSASFWLMNNSRSYPASSTDLLSTADVAIFLKFCKYKEMSVAAENKCLGELL